jgi:hypothetical protein
MLAEVEVEQEVERLDLLQVEDLVVVEQELLQQRKQAME